MKERMTAAAAAQRDWERAGLQTRLRVLQQAGAELQARSDELHRGLRADGLSQSLAEFYGQWIQHQGNPELLAAYARDHLRRIGTPGGVELYFRRPDGVVLLVTPGNSPTINAAPLFSLLLPGNAVVVRAPQNDTGLRFIAETVLQEAIVRGGFSPELVQVATGSTREILDAALPAPELRTLVFFGNSKAGHDVAERAHAHGKKAVLELEGSDHLVVWKDADLDAAVASAEHAFDFSTQPCPIPKHLLVHHAVYDAFLEKLLARVPDCSRTIEADAERGVLGPVGRPEAFAAAFEEVQAVGQVHCGGYRMNARGESDDAGAYIAPTVVGLEDEVVLGRELRCFDEEIFFPLIPVVRFRGDDDRVAEHMCEVIRRSNFGLRASVWVRDPARLAEFTREIASVGLLIFNDEHAQCPGYASPWGGPKRSGGSHGESHLFWEKASHLQAIGCRQLDDAGLQSVLDSLGVPGPQGASLACTDDFARVTLERPQRHNAVDAGMKDALLEITERLKRSQDLRAVVVTGAGRSFCSGADLDALARFDAVEARTFMFQAAWAFRCFEALPQPVIAAVQGYCLGGGFELALHCDEIIASADAIFGFPEAQLGLVTTAGSVSRLELAVGAARARSLLLGGRRIDAMEAYELGLVSRVVPHEELEAAIAERCARFAKMPREGIAAMKALLNARRRGERGDSWVRELETFDTLSAGASP